MKYPVRVGCLCLLIACILLQLIPGAGAFTVSPVTISPSGVLNPSDTVNVSCTVYAASGASFPSYDDLQFVTELDDPVWYYTIIVNGVKNTRPADRGKILTISGFELNYQNKDEVLVDVVMKARVPATAAMGSDRMILKIQELDARSNVLTYSIVRVDHLIGQPTPTPTPAYGRITVTSEPSGANVYLDNALKGITPVTLDAVTNGAHTVLVQYNGYRDYTHAMTVTGDLQEIGAVLIRNEPTPYPTATSPSGTTTSPGTSGTVTSSPTVFAPVASTGTLSVTTVPSGAIVYIDDQMKGITPTTIPGLSPGRHSITLIMDGYEDFKTTTEITAGASSEFVTGLMKRKQLPGFAMAGALLAIGLCVTLIRYRGRKD